MSSYNENLKAPWMSSSGIFAIFLWGRSEVRGVSFFCSVSVMYWNPGIAVFGLFAISAVIGNPGSRESRIGMIGLWIFIVGSVWVGKNSVGGWFSYGKDR